MNYSPETVKNTLLNLLSDMQSNAWKHTNTPQAFTRNRKISFKDTILSTISMQKSAEKTEVLKFFDFSSKAPTASALIQQRNKIPSDSFASLFYDFSNSFEFFLFPMVKMPKFKHFHHNITNSNYFFSQIYKLWLNVLTYLFLCDIIYIVVRHKGAE